MNKIDGQCTYAWVGSHKNDPCRASILKKFYELPWSKTLTLSITVSDSSNRLTYFSKFIQISNS